ncbi:MAG: Mth938-like domain-containing protein [Roseovarius sp.]|nr:Mth938-like domain-containing protein [Roseovarius sp.]
MQMSDMKYEGARPIDGYGPGFFRVDGEVAHGPILVTANSASPWRGLEETGMLVALAEDIDVLLVGTGAETEHIPNDFRNKLRDAGIGVEAMNSPAACRTFNVLISEGRRIAAALLPI